jgi:hypothetical protein
MTNKITESTLRTHIERRSNWKLIDQTRHWFKSTMGNTIHAETEVVGQLAERMFLPTKLVEDWSYDLSVTNIQLI